jgi:hypothetical protein
MKEKKTFEKELPEGYCEVFHFNAKSIKVGIIFNLIALVVLIAVMAVGRWIYVAAGTPAPRISLDGIWHSVAMLGFLAVMLLYIVLHELVHGICYKRMTGERLTFGISWSCAFCGVPNIYTYRKTSIIAASAPLILFTVMLVPMCAALMFVHPYLYMLGLFLFGMHLGGCGGDFYFVWILLFKYKSPDALMRDTGPEQFIYLPSSQQ